MDTMTQTKLHKHIHENFNLDDVPVLIGKTGILLNRFNDICLEGKKATTAEMIVIADIFDIDDIDEIFGE